MVSREVAGIGVPGAGSTPIPDMLGGMMNPVFSMYGEGSKAIFPGLPLVSSLFEAPTWWGPDDVSKEAWINLGCQLIQCGYNVAVLGTPTGDMQGAADVIGLAVSARGKGKVPHCTLLRRAVLGGVSPEVAHELRVSSASALAVHLVREVYAVHGNRHLDCNIHEFSERPGSGGCGANHMPWRSSLCSWSGPMMVYKGGGTRVSAWDQCKAYRGAWRQPMPHPTDKRLFSEAGLDAGQALDILLRCRQGEIYGFALAKVRQESFYPAWPAAVAGDAARVPLRGTSTIAIPLWSLAILIEAEAIEVLGFERVFYGIAHPTIGEDVAKVFLDWPKEVYQRFHAAATPCPRWKAKLSPTGLLTWSYQEPDASSGIPHVASLLRSAVAAKTAAFISRIPEGKAVAAHVDGIFEDTGAHSMPVPLVLPIQGYNADDSEPIDGFWTRKSSPVWGRFFAPGRWDHNGHKPAMGGVMPRSDSPEGPLFLRARQWHGDPREDSRAWSEPSESHGEYFSYTWGRDDIIEGRHGL